MSMGSEAGRRWNAWRATAPLRLLSRILMRATKGSFSCAVSTK